MFELAQITLHFKVDKADLDVYIIKKTEEAVLLPNINFDLVSETFCSI